MPFNKIPVIELSVAQTTTHFEQILKIQKANQRNALSTSEQNEFGFLYARYNIGILEKMAAYGPQIIALHNNKVVGYNLSMALALMGALPDLRAMFYAFDQTTFKNQLLKNYKYIIGGQVCVDKPYRGQGLLNRMYHEIKNRLSDQYQLCVTDVAQRNKPSLSAHLKTGFEIAGTYPHDGEMWHTVVWDWRIDN